MGATLFAFVRMIVVLGMIVGLMLLMARFARRHQSGGAVRSNPKLAGRIDVVARRSVGKNASLLVVRVASRTFFVSQSAGQVTLLSELESDEFKDHTSLSNESNTSSTDFLAPGTALGTGESSPGAWDALVDRLREMTVRR